MYCRELDIVQISADFGAPKHLKQLNGKFGYIEMISKISNENRYIGWPLVRYGEGEKDFVWVDPVYVRFKAGIEGSELARKAYALRWMKAEDTKNKAVTTYTTIAFLVSSAIVVFAGLKIAEYFLV